MSGLKDRLYPAVSTFGFYGIDGTFPFLLRLHQLLPEGGVLLDYGAGRGGQTEQADGIKRHLLDFRNRAGRVIGVDVDSVVLENPFLHDAHLLGEDGRIPLEDETADVVMADWVCEHLPSPVAAFHEIFRILKPGGWVGVRTPNKWHYSMVASRLIPDRHHERVLARAQKGREARDVFPKFYRMNTPAACRRTLAEAGFSCVLIESHEPEPVYLHFSTVAFAMGAVYQRLATLLPTHGGRLVLMGFGRKPAR